MSDQTKKTVKSNSRPKVTSPPKVQSRGAAVQRGMAMSRQRMPGTAMNRYHGN